MPIAIDPNETYSYVISTDRALPPETQPTLVFHFPTGRQQIQIADLFDRADNATSTKESLTLRFEAVRVILAGWHNFTDREGNAVEYDPARLEDVLSDNDLTELHARLLREMSMAELEKKRFALSSPSSSAGSATNATADAAPSAPAGGPAASTTAVVVPPAGEAGHLQRRRPLISNAPPAPAKTPDVPAAAAWASSD